MLPYKSPLKDFSRTLRKNQTITEQRLWHYLRRKQILGIQFYRQKPIGNFIVDFYAPKPKLVIELDGSQHFEEMHEEDDKRRDACLETYGLKVLRYSNLQILQNIKDVLEEIYWKIEERLEMGTGK